MKVEIKTPSPYGEAMQTTLILNKQGLQAEVDKILSKGHKPYVYYSYPSGNSKPHSTVIEGIGDVNTKSRVNIGSTIGDGQWADMLGLHNMSLVLVYGIQGKTAFLHDNPYGKKGEEAKFEKDWGTVPNDLLEALQIDWSKVASVEENYVAVAPIVLLSPHIYKIN